MIEREGPVAPWRQLAGLLRESIESGELAPGARLPSIASLAQEHELAVTTVQKAIQALKDEGLIVTSPMGTFVAREG
jgi:GntR family transcriptional regulator